MKGMKKIECEPQCGFMVRSHDMDELKKFGLSHAKNIHHMDVTNKDVEDMIRDA